jgi:two-component system chemotaxis family response regulator WspR
MDPYQRIRELEAALQAAKEEIQQLGRDCVSGLLGRRAFEQHLQGMFQHRRRGTDQNLGIIMCDIDHFKQVNDTYGHRVGDEVIAQVARIIQACTRTTDIAARYGGEEFVCILVQTSIAGLAVMAERIRRTVEQARVNGLPPVTISVGFALQSETDEDGWALVERADKSLYRAKAQGRNRVEGETLTDYEVKMLTEIERVRE